MAGSKVTPSDDGRVSITIPEQYAEQFRHETLCAFESAADTITEIARWTREAREGERAAAPRSIGGQDLDRLHEAESIFSQAREQERELTITAKVETLRSAVHGCRLDAADAIHEHAERIDGNVPEAMRDMEFWQSTLAGLGEEGGRS